MVDMLISHPKINRQRHKITKFLKINLMDNQGKKLLSGQ